MRQPKIWATWGESFCFRHNFASHTEMKNKSHNRIERPVLGGSAVPKESSLVPEEQEARSTVVERPPVVVVIGHVDHGKTTLLDYIRSNCAKAALQESEPRAVAGQESGGITQHIGAYEVTHSGKRITFLDTPGHEAFSKMRSRGARVADVAILVVAADEGVKPQTKEALQHIQSAKTPFIATVTKIDKPAANPEKVKQDLAKEGVLVEGWGGKVPIALVSSKTGEGIHDLLDIILLVAELEELRGNAEGPGRGVVIESHLDPQRGPTATLLVLDGVLRHGDSLVAGSTKGKVKILENFLGEKADTLSFSSPAVVLGWEELPTIGDAFLVGGEPEPTAGTGPKSVVPTASSGDSQKAISEFTLILKADVSGSLEALEGSVRELADRLGVRIKILGSSVGDANESDAKLADAARAMIVGFRAGVSREAANFVENLNLKVMSSNVIYELLEALEKEFGIWLKKLDDAKIAGRIEVLAIFKPTNNRQVVGGKVIEGKLVKGKTFSIYRKGAKIAEGTISNLQMARKDVDEVFEGNECGMLLDAPITISKGDVLEQTGA